MENRVTKTYNDNEWNLLFSNTNTVEYTIYVAGQSLIEVFVSDEASPDFSTIDDRDITTIGGLLYACNIPVNKYIFVRATTTTGGTLYYLPKGQADPNKDNTVLYQQISDLVALLVSHVQNTDDPHNTGRKYLPIDQFYTIATSVIPATAQGKFLLDAVAITLKDLIAAHTTNTTSNPHNITLEKLNIPNVANMGPAVDDVDILNTDNTNMLATIKAVHQILAYTDEVTASLPHNTILTAPIETLTATEKLYYDPKTVLAVLTGSDIAVVPGLQVTFIENGRVRKSNQLDTTLTIAQNLITNSVSIREGVHYLYCDINSSGDISSIGSTYTAPIIGNHRTNDVADFIDRLTGYVYNSAGEIIRRVYICKIIADAVGGITRLINVPRGNTFKMKISTNISPGTTYEFDNPFFGDVEVIPEIGLGTQWCDPKWNDQVGVRASFDTGRPDKIVVQTGSGGLAMIASSSGNAFTSSNLSTTHTAAAPLRLLVRKVM